jgi:3-methyl-2-oxobutanoate hydroxymethyltransferase
MSRSTQGADSRVTVPDIQARKSTREGAGPPIVMITAYDVASARAADRAGADILLVGDSLGMVVLGRENTLSVTMDEMVHHARAVAAARPRALVVGDMPYLSYHVTVPEAVRNAGRFIAEGGCQAVKVEGGRRRIETIEALIDAEIPVMGHLGLTPQSVHKMGGFRVQGRQARAAQGLIRDARLLEKAGVFAIVLEGIPAEVAALVTDAIDVPTIGIGAGAHCDGQVLVHHDLLGLSEGPAPRFVRRYADLGAAAVEALARFAADVRSGGYPAPEESYHLSAQEAEALEETLAIQTRGRDELRGGEDGAEGGGEGRKGRGAPRVVALDPARSRRRS